MASAPVQVEIFLELLQNSMGISMDLKLSGGAGGWSRVACCMRLRKMRKTHPMTSSKQSRKVESLSEVPPLGKRFL